HARAAGVPIVVAVNKMDKPEANPQRVKQELAARDLAPEEWGGKTIMVEVSARQKTGLDKLLEMLLLEAELLELRADPTAPAEGTVLEARVHKSRGPVATLLVQNGTLRIGDIVTCGSAYGRVRSMLGSRGESLAEAGPATPVELLGLSQVTEPGAVLRAARDERDAREAAERYSAIERNKRMLRRHITLQDVSQSVKSGEVKELRLIVKADVQGSLEALTAQVTLLANEQVKLLVIHQGVGPINSSDIALAAASDAVIIGFHVAVEPQAEPLARREDVEIRQYAIIYEAVDELKKAMEGLLTPKVEEVPLGRVEVRQVFRSPRGPIAGCFIVSGKAVRGEKLRLARGGQVLYTGALNSLRRFKEDVREVAQGYECGIFLDGFQDVQPGDLIELFTQQLVQEKLRL
ncbi:MAG: translation initiation factor IF-2, partial [bacterium]